MTRIALLLDVIGDRRGTAGNARLLLELAGGLRELGHDITLVSHEHDPRGNFDQLAEAVEVRSVNYGPFEKPTGKPAIMRRYWTGMRRMARLVPPDTEVVNAHDWPALRAGRLAAQRLDVPLVWTRNDDTMWERALIPGLTARGTGGRLPRLARGAFGLLDRRDAACASDIVVLSEFDAEMVRRAYGRHASVIRAGCAERFHDATDRVAARARLGASSEDFMVLAVALLVPHRRFEDLIAAIAMLDDEPAIRCLIVGPDHAAPLYADELEAEIVRLGVGARVSLRRGAISDHELRDLYAAADVYVFPSSRQSYGQAPLEALASGTPVVVSSGAGVHEVLAGRPGVEVVTPASPAELAEAIRRSRRAPRSRVQATRVWLRSALSNRRYAEAMEAVIARSGHDHAQRSPMRTGSGR